MSTRSVLMKIEAIKVAKAKKTLRKKRMEHASFLEHLKTCVACRIRWEAAHGGISQKKIAELTGTQIAVNDTGVIDKAAKVYKH